MSKKKKPSSNIIYRNLSIEEINILKTSNTSDNWNNIEVGAQFNPNLIKNCCFYGIVKIESLEQGTLEDNGIKLPVGLYNSTITNCTIGKYNAIHNVLYLSNYYTGSNVFLFNIGEMHTADDPYFGNGCVKSKKDDSFRNWIELWNGNGKRRILPFDGILPADAYIWARYRNRAKLQKKLIDFTDLIVCNNYGTVEDNAVVKHCKTIKNVNIGQSAYITGADILLNITIKSHESERTLIGEGVQLKDGIINSGCKIYFGVKAVNFIAGNCCTLSHGVRLFHTYLGDNSTISCCEVLNSLIFPVHEQLHNNSFLISCLIQGQSNIASGATIGSNHNSRAPDGEITAKRGFWPGLCSSFKHNSKFASFVLIAKGSYMYELDISFPFSLVLNTETNLKIVPAYSFLYNMYALVRNDTKYKKRDSRFIKNQNIVYEYLAPDTIDDIFHALYLLELFTGIAWFSKNKKHETDNNIITDKGKKLLKSGNISDLEITGENIEKSNRKVILIKAELAYSMYREIVNYYAVKTIVNYIEKNNIKTISEIKNIKVPFNILANIEWINIGGQLIRNTELEQILTNIEEGKIKSWKDVHNSYESCWKQYPEHKLEHAFYSLKKLHNNKNLVPSDSKWNNFCKQAIETQNKLFKLLSESRKKDHMSHFRQITFESLQEMENVYGLFKDDEIISAYDREAEKQKELINKFTI